ncbi:uncharacterized protein [Asterias amurensis]|uniref:uncharacterized protein n=1 Tax=Asterias amurensis TaxID=7602 RepID=UPI003AB8AAD1
MSAYNFETSLFHCPSPTPSQLVQIIRMEEAAHAAGTSSDSDPMIVPKTPPHLQGRAATDAYVNVWLLDNNRDQEGCDPSQLSMRRPTHTHHPGSCFATKKTTFSCNSCCKSFTRKDNLKRHKKKSHTTTFQLSPVKQFQCRTCDKTFNHRDTLKRHLKVHSRPASQQPSTSTATTPYKPYQCPICPKTFTRRENLKRHLKTYHQQSGRDERVEKPSLNNQSDDGNGVIPSTSDQQPANEIHLPEPLEHPVTDQPRVQPLEEDPVEFPDAPEDIGDELNLTIRNHWSSVRSHYLSGRSLQDTYNFRMVQGAEGLNPGVNEEAAIQIVFDNLHCRAKVNISFGLVLRHSVTGELRYFHSSVNNARFFEVPFSIGSQVDLDRMLEELRRIDVVEFGRQQRPDTKWVVESITNIIFVNKLTQFPIGAAVIELPPYVANNRGLTKLVRNLHNGAPYTDELCFFRCLALSRNADPSAMERNAKHLRDVFRQATGDPNATGGVTLDDLGTLERVFSVNVMVYSLVRHEDAVADDAVPTIFAQLVRRSRQWETQKKENLNLRNFLKTICPTHYDQKKMTQREILHFIAKGSMFRLVECDLRVPPTLKGVFEEMTPIFKNTYISKNDIGNHMRDYAE